MGMTEAHIHRCFFVMGLLVRNNRGSSASPEMWNVLPIRISNKAITHRRSAIGLMASMKNPDKTPVLICIISCISKKKLRYTNTGMNQYSDNCRKAIKCKTIAIRA